MKSLKSIIFFSVLTLISLSLYNCSKDADVQELTVENSEFESIKTYLAEQAHNSTLEASKIEVVIFDQFKPYIHDGFDLSNNDQKIELINSLPTDLLDEATALRNYFVLVRKNNVDGADKAFSNTIEETIVALRALLTENRITDLDDVPSLQNESCSYSSIIVGYYFNYWRGIYMPIYATGPFSCTTNRAVFYEGNNYTGDILFTIDASTNRFINFKNYSQYENDEARSIKFWHFSPGQIVTVYDSPNGSTNDDYTVFRFFSGVDTTEEAHTFERNFSSSDFTQSFNEDNGLDGKVSSVRFSGN